MNGAKHIQTLGWAMLYWPLRATDWKRPNYRALRATLNRYKAVRYHRIDNLPVRQDHDPELPGLTGTPRLFSAFSYDGQVFFGNPRTD
jgi:hypothetical protein